MIAFGLAALLFGWDWVTARAADHDPVQAVAVAQDGTIWMGKKSALFRLKGDGTVERTRFPGGVRQLLTDPGAPSVLYALSEAGPLYRTTDGGQTWTPTAGEKLPAARIRAVAYDPSGPTRLVALVEGNGYYQSETSGRSWRRMGRQDIPDAGALAVNPLDPRTILVGALDGLYESTNQGARFAAVEPQYPWNLRGPVAALAVAGDRSATLAAAGGALFRSADGGRSWLSVGTEAPRNVTAVAVDPWRPRIIVAGTGEGALAISRDEGRTWQYIR